MLNGVFLWVEVQVIIFFCSFASLLVEIMNNAQAVANEFITLANNDGVKIDTLKLNKLVYLAHGFALVLLKDNPIIDKRFDEVQAWKYGPVIPSVYFSFSHLKSNNVTINDIATSDASHGYEPFVLCSTDAKDIVKYVWTLFKDMSGRELVEMLHKRNTPWDICYVPHKNMPIPDEITEKYYRNVLELAGAKFA